MTSSSGMDPVAPGRPALRPPASGAALPEPPADSSAPPRTEPLPGPGPRPPVEPASGAEEALVSVLFKGLRLEIFQNPERIPVEPGDAVIVEVERGSDLGEVFFVGRPDTRRKKDQEPCRILRRATSEEKERLAQLRASDPEALVRVKERVARFGLPMHMVDAEYQFDGHRVTFYFTADHRIDFRDLVRDLAGIFRTRIELRQISTREAARRLGGIGTCGRVICCRCLLCGFERVSLQSARDQKLAISPVRLSGICGRLLCCLNFESEEAPCNGLDAWVGPRESSRQ